MSESNGRCEFEFLDYCFIPDEYRGYICPRALPLVEGDIGQKCGCPDDELMTEEEWEDSQKVQ